MPSIYLSISCHLDFTSDQHLCKLNVIQSASISVAGVAVELHLLDGGRSAAESLQGRRCARSGKCSRDERLPQIGIGFPHFDVKVLGGHTYMTSAVGGGGRSPRSRQKERGCVNYVRDKRGGVEKSGNFADVINGSPLMVTPGLKSVKNRSLSFSHDDTNYSPSRART